MSRGGRSTKIHAIVDALGNPIHVQLSAGNVHDVMVAEELLSAISIEGSVVLADKAYGAFRLREYIATHHADYCIPPKSMNQSHVVEIQGTTSCGMLFPQAEGVSPRCHPLR